MDKPTDTRSGSTADKRRCENSHRHRSTADARAQYGDNHTRTRHRAHALIRSHLEKTPDSELTSGLARQHTATDGQRRANGNTNGNADCVRKSRQLRNNSQGSDASSSANPARPGVGAQLRSKQQARKTDDGVHGAVTE